MRVHDSASISAGPDDLTDSSGGERRRMKSEVISVKFEADESDHMKLARIREEIPMTKKIELARGGPGAGHRCPSCDGPYDVVVGGMGWTTCPHCDTRLHLGGDEVFAGEVIAASSGYDLTPMERRMARQVGVSFEQAQNAKRPY